MCYIYKIVKKNIPYIENIDRDTFNKLTVNLLLNFNEENFNNMIENTEDFYVKNWYKNNI